jgi:hypothetical protein
MLMCGAIAQVALQQAELDKYLATVDKKSLTVKTCIVVHHGVRQLGSRYFLTTNRKYDT